jgi:acetaldehyde dehydrogenase (acetylating)
VGNARFLVDLAFGPEAVPLVELERMRHGLSTAILPMWPLGSSRPVPIAASFSNATACRHCASIASSSISAGTRCSRTNTSKRIGDASSRALSQLMSSIRTMMRKV